MIVPSFYSSVTILMITCLKLSFGIPLEFFTSTENIDSNVSLHNVHNNLSRRNLCPPNQTSAIYRYHRKSKKCYKIGESGPCGRYMSFISEDNSSIFGECECSDHENIPLIYNEKSERCFLVYTQAWCERGKILVLNENEEPECIQNKCSDTFLLPDSNPIVVKFMGKCVSIFSHHPNCNKEEVVIVHPEHQNQLICGKISVEVIQTSVYTVPRLKCRPGSRRDIDKKCRRPLKTTHILFDP